MFKILPAFTIACVLFAVPVYAADNSGFNFKADPAIKQVLPEKPVRIKLRRLSGGDYTWEITGDDPAKVAEAEKKLRELMGVK